jgi:hypothetical protein
VFDALHTLLVTAWPVATVLPSLTTSAIDTSQARCICSFEGGTAADLPITALRMTSKLETFAADPLVATVLTNGGSLPAVWVEEDRETDARPTEFKYEQLHKGALHGGQALVVSANVRGMGTKEFVMVPMMATDANGQPRRRVYWGYHVLPALVKAQDDLLPKCQVRLVLDLDDTAVDSTTLRGLQRKIARRAAQLLNPPAGTKRLDELIWQAEKQMMDEDAVKFQAFLDGRPVMHKGEELTPKMETSVDAYGVTNTKRVLRIRDPDGDIFFSCTNADDAVRTAIMIRVRPRWSEFCAYARGRCSISVESAGDLPYAWEVWRLLDPETAQGTYLIKPEDRKARILSVQAWCGIACVDNNPPAATVVASRKVNVRHHLPLATHCWPLALPLLPLPRHSVPPQGEHQRQRHPPGHCREPPNIQPADRVSVCGQHTTAACSCTFTAHAYHCHCSDSPVKVHRQLSS